MVVAAEGLTIHSEKTYEIIYDFSFKGQMESCCVADVRPQRKKRNL